MPHFGLSERSTQAILDVFAKFPDVEQAIIYGSRAKGNYREGSDIDLTLKGENLTPEKLYRIQDALDEAPTPYLFDVSIYKNLTNPNLIDQINKIGKVFYQK